MVKFLNAETAENAEQMRKSPRAPRSLRYYLRGTCVIKQKSRSDRNRTAKSISLATGLENSERSDRQVTIAGKLSSHDVARDLQTRE